LRTVLEAAGVGWLVPDDDADDVAARVLQEIAELEDYLRDRLGVDTELLADFDRDERLAAVVQTFASPMTTAMRAMAYAVVTGGRVETLDVRYRYGREVALRVEVAMPEGGSLEFASDELWDFQALRHFGLLKAGGRPVIDGFYATRWGQT